MSGWYRVSLPYATFGVRVEDDWIVEAAPIARWTVGKPFRYAANYWRRHDAGIERL